MSYSINPASLESMFAVPSEIADKHIKLASGTQLKVLLLFIKNSRLENIEDVITSALCISGDELHNALNFWVQRGILLSTGSVNTPSTVKKQKSKRSVAIAAKPTREESIRRMEQSDEIRFLATEVQEKLGRLITQAETSTLIWIHDNQGLDVPIILMSVEYAVRIGKPSFSYIEKVCIDWANNEITTLEAAEQRLNRLYAKNKAWQSVEAAFGIPHRRATERESGYADRWVNSYGFSRQLLTAAYDRCIDSTGKLSFAYINTILEKWHKAGVKTIEDIKSLSADKPKSSEKAVSYNIDKINKQFNNFD